ncbi:hypothetical protein [Bdellovibrio sp. HCB-110]|uniref:hypothetical protein n=1 Tax=Bdellovibrio sp. HCB-110 TaxID=3391182 RepID=UPI0039B496A9
MKSKYPYKNWILVFLTSSILSSHSLAANWVDLARQAQLTNAQGDMTPVSEVMDIQMVTAFQLVTELMSSFAQVQNFQFQQQLQTQPVSAEKLLESPILLYRHRNLPNVSQKTYLHFDLMMTSVLGILSRVEFPEPFPSENKIKIRVENALRKIHMSELLPTAQKLAQQPNASESAKQGYAFLLNLKSQSDRDRAQNYGLPHPELNRADRHALSAFLGGALWRFRGAGGYDNLGTNDRRDIFVGSGFTAIATLNGANAEEASAIGTALKWGVKLVSWGEYHDMGRLPGKNKYSDFKAMEKIGRDVTSRVKDVLIQNGFPNSALISAAGSSFASCYYSSWERVSPQLRVGADLTPPFMFIFAAPTNFGEFCSGASLGLALSESLLGRD